MDIELIRQRIRSIRKDKGLSQRALAAIINMDYRNYARIERGERKNIDISLLNLIGKALEINPIEFIISPDVLFLTGQQNCTPKSR